MLVISNNMGYFRFFFHSTLSDFPFSIYDISIFNVQFVIRISNTNTGEKIHKIISVFFRFVDSFVDLFIVFYCIEINVYIQNATKQTNCSEITKYENIKINKRKANCVASKYCAIKLCGKF